MTDTREIELEVRGRSCFVAALESHDVASALSDASALEKEKVLLSVVSDAHELLEGSLAESGEVLTSEDLLWINRGISLACEEWIRSPEEINAIGV